MGGFVPITRPPQHPITLRNGGDQLGDLGDEGLLLGVAALEVSTRSARVAATAELGGDGGHVEILLQAAQADAPATPVLILIEDDGDARALGTGQEVDDPLGFDHLGAAMLEAFAGHLGPDDRAVPADVVQGVFPETDGGARFQPEELVDYRFYLRAALDQL